MVDYYLRVYKYINKDNPDESDCEKIDQINREVPDNDNRTEKEIIIEMLETLLKLYKGEI